MHKRSFVWGGGGCRTLRRLLEQMPGYSVSGCWQVSRLHLLNSSAAKRAMCSQWSVVSDHASSMTWLTVSSILRALSYRSLREHGNLTLGLQLGRVKKSKLLILSECVNKTSWEDRRNVNKYEQLQRKWSIVWFLTWNILRHDCFTFKYSMTEAINEITGQTPWQTRTSLRKHDVIKVCSMEYLTTHVELLN